MKFFFFIAWNYFNQYILREIEANFCFTGPEKNREAILVNILMK